MLIQSTSMRIGRVRTANVEKPNRIECASSQSTCWGGLKLDWTGLEWNVVGRGLCHVTTCELPLWEWLLGGRTWRRRRARTWRRRRCWGSGIATGSIFFVNVVRVMCTRQGHARISFSGFALVRIEKPVRTQSNWIEPDWNRFKQFMLNAHWIQFAVRTGLKIGSRTFCRSTETIILRCFDLRIFFSYRNETINRGRLSYIYAQPRRTNQQVYNSSVWKAQKCKKPKSKESKTMC